MRSEAGSMGSVILRAVSPPEGSRGCFLWISRARSLPFGDATGPRAGLGMTTLRPAHMQSVVVPSERSDSAASPEGARDLPLILSHFKCRFFPSGDAPRSGFALRMTHQSQERVGTALVCHPERSEGSGVKNLQAEILPLRGRDRPKNRPQDDKTRQSLPQIVFLYDHFSGREESSSHPLLKSLQPEFSFSTRAFFFALIHPFISFSLAIAVFTSFVSSKYTSL